MAKRKTVENAEETAGPAQPDTTPTEFPPASNEQPQEPDEHKGTWLARFNTWTDNQAGVSVIEDRDNHRMTVKFDEKPSEAVRALLKDREHGYQFDASDQVWYKRIDRAK